MFVKNLSGEAKHYQYLLRSGLKFLTAVLGEATTRFTSTGCPDLCVEECRPPCCSQGCWTQCRGSDCAAGIV